MLKFAILFTFGLKMINYNSPEWQLNGRLYSTVLCWASRQDEKITVFPEQISRNCTLVDPDAFVCLYFHKRNVKNLDNTPDCEASSLQNKGNNLWTKAIEYILKNSSIF